MKPDEAMRRIETQLSHVWMVRAFLKHCDEAQEDEELQDVHRALYDYQLAVGTAWREQNAKEYLHLARKKFSKLRGATEQFTRIQPEISSHTNFKMAATSLTAAVDEIAQILNNSDTKITMREEGIGGPPSQ